LYNEIKKKDQKAKVCFLTASEQYRENQREAKYRDLAQDLFIQKPISFEDLLGGAALTSSNTCSSNMETSILGARVELRFIHCYVAYEGNKIFILP
jgi:hypothetical protein